MVWHKGGKIALFEGVGKYDNIGDLSVGLAWKEVSSDKAASASEGETHQGEGNL